jgi:hypothetical protein
MRAVRQGDDEGVPVKVDEQGLWCHDQHEVPLGKKSPDDRSFRSREEEVEVARMWKKGRGKLGLFQPLLGRWVAEANSEMGPVRCTRSFEPVLEGIYIELRARWEFGRLAARPDCNDARGSSLAGKVYEEIALFGAGADGQVAFWSFTSDGKRSEGIVADVTDLHAEAIGFEAQMPAGRARQAYWPVEGGFLWVVESRNAQGWRRFVEHTYGPA